MNLLAFRHRDGETGAIRASEPLRSLLSFTKPVDSVGRAVRQAQLDAVVRLVPATVSAQLLAAGLLAVSLIGQIPEIQLIAWCAAILVLCATRAIRALRLRSDPVYSRRKPTSLFSVVAVISALAILWLIPPVLWFGQVDTDHQMMIGVILIALMSAGCVSLGSLPQAVFVYIGVMMTGGLVMTSHYATPVHSALLLIFGFALAASAVATGRRFVGHVRIQIELQEQSELISLLREFESSGSDWLWELDADERIVYLSPAMAEALEVPADQVIGKAAREILDPDGLVSPLSAGIRRIGEHVANRQAFRGIAVPVQHGRRWWSLSGKPLEDNDGRILGWRGVGSDITDLRHGGDDIVRAARLDPLTGLANRLLIREELEEVLLRQLGGDEGCALLLVDLDRFKLVNDTLGHSVGDMLLCEVARRLEDSVGDDGIVGRLGGDEFAIVWRGASDRQSLCQLAERLIAELSRTLTIGAADLHVGATVGIARSPADGNGEDSLMRSADLALYSQKNRRRGGHAFFEQRMFVAAEDYRSLENDLRTALESGGLSLHYQSIVESSTRREIGREALLRWNHPERGAIPPEQFVPIIEDAGLIHRIGDWVIREACTEAMRWPGELSIAVNVSAAQLTGAGIAETVLGALAATGLDPARLDLEVTESIFIGDDMAILGALERLRSIGVRLVLDDFGKGYSSLGYLSRARFAKLKIDREFVRGAALGERDCTAIVQAILALAGGLGVETTAEGVETECEADMMRTLGCGQMQGFLFGRPMPPALLDGGTLLKRA